MARVDKGDPLNSGFGKLQPGYSIENDGFGLLTCKADYIRDGIYNFNANSIRDTSFEKDGRLFAHKFSIQHLSLQRAKITIDYVGIDTTQPGGGQYWTRPQVSGSNGLSTEKIETHPCFFTVADGWIMNDAIAGVGPYTQSDLGPIITKPDKTNDRSYIGNNGACFERADGGRFIGFVDKNYPNLYGKTSYLAPTTVWSGIVYTNNVEKVQNFRKAIGCITNTNNIFGSSDLDAPDFIPTVYGTNFVAPDRGWQLLVSKVDVENFGNLYKINYEIRYSKSGFDFNVYDIVSI